jgi:hypothetical protein
MSGFMIFSGAYALEENKASIGSGATLSSSYPKPRSRRSRTSSHARFSRQTTAEGQLIGSVKNETGDCRRGLLQLFQRLQYRRIFNSIWNDWIGILQYRRYVRIMFTNLPSRANG